MSASTENNCESGELPLEELLVRHRAAFCERFGDSGEVRLFFAPGRVNLMGAHLDYNGGPVMPMTVHNGTFIAALCRTDKKLRLATTFGVETHELDLGRLPERALGAWVDYPLGVARTLLDQVEAPLGLDLLFGGNLPIGAGLSSSASICVGTAFALDHMWDSSLAPESRVQAALTAEREFVGVQCGIMDPFAVGYACPGHLLWLDCKDESLEHIPLDFSKVRIAVIDTTVRRQLAHGEFNQRVAECRQAFEALGPFAEGATCLRDIPSAVLEEHFGDLEPAVARRARHVLTEVERTFTAREALINGDLAMFGAQMSAAHRSLAEDFEVSVGELDCLVNAALEVDGVLGSRLTGAGFGGCVVVLLHAAACDDLEAHVTAAYQRDFSLTPKMWFFEGDAGPRELEL